MLVALVALMRAATLNTFTEYSYTREIRYYAITRWTNVCDITHIIAVVVRVMGVKEFFMFACHWIICWLIIKCSGFSPGVYNYFVLVRPFASSLPFESVKYVSQLPIYQSLKTKLKINNAINTCCSMQIQLAYNIVWFLAYYWKYFASQQYGTKNRNEYRVKLSAIS